MKINKLRYHLLITCKICVLNENYSSVLSCLWHSCLQTSSYVMIHELIIQSQLKLLRVFLSNKILLLIFSETLFREYNHFVLTLAILYLAYDHWFHSNSRKKTHTSNLEQNSWGAYFCNKNISIFKNIVSIIYDVQIESLGGKRRIRFSLSFVIHWNFVYE